MSATLHRIGRLAAPAALATLLVLAGCATAPPPLGAPREAVLEAWGPPTSRYTMPEGGERLEYATGPAGRTTWMIDIDGAGRVRSAAQVLNEANFLAFQARAPGMTRDQVLRELGRPGEVKGVGRFGGILWSWRYPTNDCLWFQVEFDRQGNALSAGYNTDPTCDKPTTWR